MTDLKKIVLLTLIAILFPGVRSGFAARYIFDDEFNGNALSSSWIALNVYDNVNNERQCYVPSQITVKDGYLNSTAIAQKTICSNMIKSFASGAVVWAPPLSFKYGTVEYRAKFAGGKGTWPAIWLLGTDCQPDSAGVYNAKTCDWPHAGSNEIDITEVKFSNFIRPWQNVINPDGFWTTCQPHVSDVSQNFHKYAFTWTPHRLTWYIDDKKTCETTDPAFIPSTPMYLIINTSVGGNGASAIVKKSTLPQTTKVDYIRVSPLNSN